MTNQEIDELSAAMATIQLGDEVRYKLGPRTEAVTGLVTAVETYTDHHGTRRWLYVTWVDHTGQPSKDHSKHHEYELAALKAVGVEVG